VVLDPAEGVRAGAVEAGDPGAGVLC
jgi:hypothetical protein